MFISMSNKKIFRSAMSLVLVVVFICVNVKPTYANNGFISSIPEVIPVSVVDVPYTPAIMTGMTIYPEDVLKFDFIIDSGDEELKGEEFRKESERLIHYFMASLTVPDDEMWVNLSPYEEDRIIAEGLGETELGKDMLGQDYMLKNLTGSLLSPKEDVGREFWERLYKKVEENLGTRDVRLKTFNKIWIVPESADVYVKENTVFIVGSRLKVMLEQDYLALEHHDEELEGQDVSESMTEETVRILREIVVPEIEREVNEGKSFAKLRQMYNAIILANWYKRKYSGGRLSEEYVGKNNVLGIELKDKGMKEKIYVEYVKAFEEGVYDEVVEVYDPDSQEIVVNHYFSGGLDYSLLENIVEEVVNKGVLTGLLERVYNNVPVEVDITDNGVLNKWDVVKNVAVIIISVATILGIIFTSGLIMNIIFMVGSMIVHIFGITDNYISRMIYLCSIILICVTYIMYVMGGVIGSIISLCILIFGIGMIYFEDITIINDDVDAILKRMDSILEPMNSSFESINASLGDINSNLRVIYDILETVEKGEEINNSSSIENILKTVEDKMLSIENTLKGMDMYSGFKHIKGAFVQNIDNSLKKVIIIILDIRSYLESTKESKYSETQKFTLESIVKSLRHFLKDFPEEPPNKDNSVSLKNSNGGIDFNPNNMTISETGDKSYVRSIVKDGIPNNMYNAMRRVTAVISSNITPITNLPQLLGL